MNPNPIIVALDVPTEDAAFQLVDQLGNSVGFYKIGLQLFTRYGPSIATRVKETGAKLFLDLKFHDIPNTVQHAVESACGLGADMLTIHLCGGSQMIRAAAAGLCDAPAQLLGVTVLTSISQENLREIAVESDVGDQVLRLARLALSNGIRGIVASPQEIDLLRREFGNALTIVTPGVRPKWAASDDQQRVLTPGEAMKKGADYLVIGRPITAHPSPREAVQLVLNEIAAAVKEP